jgi:hypothetical protein
MSEESKLLDLAFLRETPKIRRLLEIEVRVKIQL